MKAHSVDHHEVTRTLPPFGQVIVLRGTTTDLVAMLDIEQGETVLRGGASRFASGRTAGAPDGGAR